MTLWTLLWWSTSLSVAPSPPPPIKTDLGSGWARKERVYQALVVDMFVRLGGLGLSIKYQATSEGFCIQDVHHLVGGLSGVDNVLDTIENHQVLGYQFEMPFTR